MTVSDEFLEVLIRAWVNQMKMMGATPVVLIARADNGLHCFASDNVTVKEIATAAANLLVMMAIGEGPEGAIS